MSGLLILVPLLFRAIRKSFLPSMFFFFTGMLTLTRGMLTCLSQALKLEFGSDSITYGVQTITKKDLVPITNLLDSFVLPLFLILIILFETTQQYKKKKQQKKHNNNNLQIMSHIVNLLIGSFVKSI